ncbi:MAG: hypothetical protein ACLGH0_05600 [Thermoanaerobaculia bacterium]
MTMNEHHFEAEITLFPRVAGDNAELATVADKTAWASARELLRERTYGSVRIEAEWPAIAGFEDETPIPVPIRVTEDVDARDVPAYLELYFHDIYLLMNLAVPGSFGAAVSIGGGEFRVAQMTFDGSVLEWAWVTASRRGKPSITVLPLQKVIAWYDALGIGTQQLATTAEAKALFQLLSLGRGATAGPVAIVMLAQAIEALYEVAPRELHDLFALRETFANGTAPVIHPMHDDGLDERVSDVELAWVDATDRASSYVVSAIQERIIGS